MLRCYFSILVYGYEIWMLNASLKLLMSKKKKNIFEMCRYQASLENFMDEKGFCSCPQMHVERDISLSEYDRVEFNALVTHAV